MEIEILSSVDAAINGYLSLTTPYDQLRPEEVQWMKNVLNDLKGCSVVIVETSLGYEVARHKSEMILAEPRK